MLVFLAAPARSQTPKNNASRFETAPKHETKPKSEQSTLEPPPPGGPREILRDPPRYLTVWLTSLLAPSRMSRPASPRSRVMHKGVAIRNVEWPAVMIASPRRNDFIMISCASLSAYSFVLGS